jgi:hypothetical protein
MTTQEKAAAIQKIAKNREENRAAVQAAGVSPLLIELIDDAVNSVFKADLAKVFAN